MPGTTNLNGAADVHRLIDSAVNGGKRIAAICAAPSVLGTRGYLKGKEAICYPGFEETLFGAKVVKKNVVKDENIITSRENKVKPLFNNMLEIYSRKK